MAQFQGPNGVITAKGELAKTYDKHPAYVRLAPVTPEINEMDAKELSEALKTADQPVSGTVAQKRQRLAQTTKAGE